ncbi:hypothetical protein B5F13_01095 [Drancourtella sp. An177]|nr:hypothetical protein B5F13_01095 [Drancourtella sp. An177]
MDITSEKNNLKCINYLIAYLVMQALNYFVKLVLGEFTMWGVISKAVLALFMLRGLTVILRRKFIPFCAIETLCLISFIVTFIVGDFGTTIGTELFNLVGVFIPLAFSVACIDDFELCLNKLYISAWPVSLILLIVSIKQQFSIYDYNMPLSYALLLQVMIFVDRYINKRKIYDLLISIVLFVFILVGGARGPILCFGVYVILLLLFSKSISKKNKILFIALIIFLGTAFLLNMDSILKALIELFEKKGISSRSLYYIYNRNFSDSGRSAIYNDYIQKALDGPVVGYGTGGGWINYIYPHNIFVEFILSYGIILGLMISFAYVWILVRGLKIKNVHIQRLALIFIAYGSSLLISNSFILEPMFFVMLPLCLAETRIIMGRR